MSEVSLSPQDFKRRVRRAFAVFVVAVVAALSLVYAVRHAERSDEIPWPLRKALNFNQAIGESVVGLERGAPEKLSAPPKGKLARVNGDVGLEDDIDLANWRLEVISPIGQQAVSQQFSMQDLRQLEKVEITTQFKCIEGWSEVMSFGGVRFRDFLKHFRLGTKNGQEPDWENHPHELFRYVNLETPNGQYYVSIDMHSLLNKDALLAFEQNGVDLTFEHGAPLRLYVPNKYGVKNIKRIGRITFSDTLGPDYWAQRGYDFFAGL